MVVRHRVTYDDFAKLPDDGLRQELIDGELYVNPSPATRHQKIVGRIFAALYNFLERQGGGEVFVAPYDVVFSETDVVEPDIVFISEADAGVVTEKNIQGVPSLVIEVVSDPGRDRGIKLKLYEQFKVPVYWVIDPDANQVEIYHLAEKRYSKPQVLKPKQVLRFRSLPGFSLDLAELFRG